jgi:hypothetical protein
VPTPLHAAASAAAAATFFAVSNLTQPIFNSPQKRPDVKYNWLVPYTWNASHIQMQLLLTVTTLSKCA